MSSSPTMSTLDDRIRLADRRCHALWSTEPSTTSERRSSLLTELAAVEHDLVGASLRLLDAEDRSSTAGSVSQQRLRRRLSAIELRLAALESHWLPRSA